MTKLQAATDTVKELAFWYIMLIFITASVFSIVEGVSYGDAFYWAATTATSTGYGDLSPKTALGKIDAVLLMHLSIFVIAPMVVVRLIDRLTVNHDAFSHDEQQTLLADVTALRVMAERGDRDAFIAGWWVNAATPGENGAASPEYFDGCAQRDYVDWKEGT